MVKGKKAPVNKKRLTTRPLKTKHTPETPAQKANRLRARAKYKKEVKKMNTAVLLAAIKSRKAVKRELNKYKRLKLRCGRKKRAAEQVKESDITNAPMNTVQEIREAMDKLMLLRAQEKLTQTMKRHQLEIEGQKSKIRVVELRTDIKKAKWECKPKTRARRNTVVRKSATTWHRLLKKQKKVYTRKKWLLNHMHYIYIGKAAMLKKNCKGKARPKRHRKRKLSRKQKGNLAWMKRQPWYKADQRKRKRGKRGASADEKKKGLMRLFDSLKQMREKQNKAEEDSQLAQKADNKRLETIVKGLEKKLTEAKGNCSASSKIMSRVKRHVYNFYTIKMKRDEAAIADRYDRAAKSSKPTQKPAKSTQKPAKSTQKPAKATPKPTSKPKKYVGRVPTM